MPGEQQPLRERHALPADGQEQPRLDEADEALVSLDISEEAPLIGAMSLEAWLAETAATLTAATLTGELAPRGLGASPRGGVRGPERRRGRELCLLLLPVLLHRRQLLLHVHVLRPLRLLLELRLLPQLRLLLEEQKLVPLMDLLLEDLLRLLLRVHVRHEVLRQPAWRRCCRACACCCTCACCCSRSWCCWN